MFRDPGRSPQLFHYLRSFSIDGPSLSPPLDHPGAVMLAEILTHSTHLEVLKFHNNYGSQIACFTELRGTLTNFTRLHTLSVPNASSDLLDWLKEFKAPLRSLRMAFYHGNLHEGRAALANFSNTLTTLQMDWVTFEPESANSLCLPNVHTLDAGFHEIVPASIIFRIFPNVQHLYVLMRNEGYYEPPEDEEMVREHLINKEAMQRAFSRPPSLIDLSGDPSDLYRSGITCTVQRWRAERFDEDNALWITPLLPYICSDVVEIVVSSHNRSLLDSVIGELRAAVTSMSSSLCLLRW